MSPRSEHGARSPGRDEIVIHPDQISSRPCLASPREEREGRSPRQDEPVVNNSGVRADGKDVATPQSSPPPGSPNLKRGGLPRSTSVPENFDEALLDRGPHS